MLGVSWCTAKWLRVGQRSGSLSPRFFYGRGEMKQRDLVFEALLDGCANVVLCIFHVLLTCGECGFNSLVSWSYSKE